MSAANKKRPDRLARDCDDGGWVVGRGDAVALEHLKAGRLDLIADAGDAPLSNPGHIVVVIDLIDGGELRTLVDVHRHQHDRSEDDSE